MLVPVFLPACVCVCEGAHAYVGAAWLQVLGNQHSHVQWGCGNPLKQRLRRDCETTHHSSHGFVALIYCQNDDAPPSPSQLHESLLPSPPLKFPPLSAGKLNCVGMLCASFLWHLNGLFSISHQGVLQGARSGYQNSFQWRIRTN